MSSAHPNGSNTLFPELIALHGGRWRCTRRVQVRNASQVVDALFPADASADTAPITAATTAIFTDLRLIDSRILPTDKDGTLTLTYETLTSTFAEEEPNRIDYEINGLKRTRRTLIALPGTSTAAYIVGTQAYGAAPVQYLASLQIETSDAYTRIKAEYLEPGVLSKARRPGEITGTVAETWSTWMVDPTDAAAMTAAGSGAALVGTVIADVTENVQGYPARSVTVLTGTLAGVKTSYKDAIEVRTPGTVTLSTILVDISGATGSVAVMSQVPPRVKTIYATVQVEITTTPPNSGDQLAYNLEGISCSVTSTGASYRELGSDTFTTVGGNASITGRKASMSVDASISTFPGCFCASSTQTGTVTYTGAYEPNPADLSGNSIIMNALTSTSKNTLTPSGATAAGAAEGYYTTGIIQRKARPVLTTLAGVTYWEVVTWTAT